MSNLLLLQKIAEFSAPTRIVIFLNILLLVWMPLAIPIYFLVEDVNLQSIWTITLLYIEFIILVRLWGKKVYQQPHLLCDYGLIINRRNFQLFFQGLGIGLFCLFSLLILEMFLGWVVWVSPPGNLLKFIFEGLLVSVGIGFAEELLFRGWLLDELERNYQSTIVLWVSSIVYAVLHFIKPIEEIWRTLLQFPGLVLLGLIFVWAKRSSGKKLNKFTNKKEELLGFPMGIHAGLVWGYYIVNVSGLVKYDDEVGDWLIGIDGNPLMGLMGLLFLGVIAFGVRRS
ncbi:MAG: type II CAAX endopeptidase family protein [Trichodesmium sp. St16_bin4-tuft]|nr:CPBP family intramembrane metalloprotease [Trichodesmium sp. MAG_R01]MDE5077217.1 type II CAAX endopeptidase family protein [Trichodesmium sp. St2_bin6]MDE5098035.1 type II CAAX endopeptidase family protein [Trichodesmium sp. St16_bin4-tuft]